MLAVGATASAADPVSGVLNVVGATATQQLDAVAHEATSVPLPVTPPAAVAQVSANAAQSVAAIPQTVAGAGNAVSASGGGVSEQARPGESSARGESSDARRPSPARSLITAATLAGRVATPTPASGSHVTIVPAARRIVSARIDRVTSTLASAERRAPTALASGGRAADLAGALLGAVASVATSARDTLAAIPLPIPTVASLLRGTPPDPTALLPAGGGVGTAVASMTLPGVDPTVLAASLATTGSAQDAPSSFGSLGMTLVEQAAAQHQTLPQPRGGVHDTSMHATSATLPSANLLTKANAPAVAIPAPGKALPAPSPGGFAPASSASAGGGLSAATFLVFAALLLLGAPRARRRLRRTGASWRLAQFSLIPARPG